MNQGLDREAMLLYGWRSVATPSALVDCFEGRVARSATVQRYT